MLSLLIRRPRPVVLRLPLLPLGRCQFSHTPPERKQKSSQHETHKQQIIARKKAGVDSFIKQGVVKTAADLFKATDEEEYLREEPDDPFFKEPSNSASTDTEEREYILFEEEKPKKKRKKAEEDTDAVLQNFKRGSEFQHCYDDWCAYYRPIFEQAPYALGYQEPGENNSYTWSHALESANKMVFGNMGFRPLQLEALNASLRGDDVFISLPTGGGKSLCFWLRALLSPGFVIVVSPLVALMHDQIQKLSSRGIPVLRLDSTTKAGAMKALKKESLPYKLIYLTPERMRSGEFMDILRDLYAKDLISMIAIDEAHCISEWGHDFRPSYRRLGVFREEFPKVPIMAMTATATPQVQKDILANLHIEDTATVFESSFNRPNIYYEVRPKVSVSDDIAHFISSEKYKKASGLIYCLTKNDAQELSDDLRSRGIHASPYHSSMAAAMRSKIQDAWKDGEIKVLCTTTAFGLGVDKADLRYVIHHTVPLSLEAYYQQTGRAGRDGLDSTCILYYAQSDFLRAAKMLASVSTNNPHSSNLEESESVLEAGGQMGVKVDLMDNVIAYCTELKKCRREILLSYFGEKIHRSLCGHKCDNCQHVLVAKAKRPNSGTDLSPAPAPAPTPTPSTATFDFLPPPHISLQQGHSRQPAIPEKEDIAEEDEFLEEEEEEEKLSPLAKLRRRRQARKEMHREKLLRPGAATAGQSPALVYDKVSKARSKRARDRIKQYTTMKKESEKRSERLRDKHFSPEDNNKDKEVVGTNNPSKFVKPAKLNKTGKLETAPTDQTPEKQFKKFGNSLRNVAVDKLNKTGRINPSDQATDEEDSTRKPKRVLAVIKKFNSLQFKSSKPNKTGRLDTEKETADTKPKFKNSLWNPNKEKINKTGKIQQLDTPENDGLTYTYNKYQAKPTKFNKTTKLNKTGRIDPNAEEGITRTYTTKTKLNKTGRITDTIPTTSTSTTQNKTTPQSPTQSPTQTATPTTTTKAPSLTQETSTTPKFKLRDYLTQLQANSITTASHGTNIASAAMKVPTKSAAASFFSLQQVYSEIAKDNKGTANSKESGEFFSDSVMAKIWTMKPTSILELTSIPGVGAKNAAKYAEKILPLFRNK